MSVSGGPDIVENGLVLCLDAGNTKSYPGSGTAWTDLSRRGNNGTLTNGPTFNSENGGSIVFDGSNDYVQCAGSIVTTAATFLVWMYRNGNQGGYAGILFSRSTDVTGMNFVTDNQLGYHWNNTPNTAGWHSGVTVPSLQWCLCAISANSTSATAYLCQQTGITSATNNVGHSSTTLDYIRVGVDSATGVRYFNGRIAVAQIYNRALSRDEIIQNYNATKGRFRL